ncbi:hypothetical protein [Pseudovibrio brasiliensis]|uniref:Uncharacterized protein n=1 Tax=Pseudovibrio brasiliensis TaxID=1898042 RepID=A0ABX8AHE6_9HYPH|nr:hypothetical protein [Pseudovibrio brasiliensis]QUS54487.1 hypothetical protein KGB56_13915 [Pseudovibrio brasiliensis]
MATPGDLVKTCFIEPMQGSFKKTPGTNPEAYFSSLSAKLSGFSEDALKAAASNLIERATSATWPYVGTITAACKSAQERLGAKESGQPNPVQAGYPWPEAVAVRVLINQDARLATSAALAGWHADLIDFVRREKRVPSMEEVEPFVVATMQRDARIAKQQQEALDVLRGEYNSKLEKLPANHRVQIMASSIANRRNRLAVMIAKEIEAREEVADDQL